MKNDETEIQELKRQLLYWKGVVRGARFELHEANRLSDEEYAHLCSDAAARDFVSDVDFLRDNRDEWKTVAQDLASALIDAPVGEWGSKEVALANYAALKNKK